MYRPLPPWMVRCWQSDWPEDSVDVGDCGESFLPRPDQVHAVFPYPRDEGLQEFMVVDFDLFAAAFLQVPVDGHEGGKPEAGLDYPEPEGTGLGQGLTVGKGDEPLETKFC